MARPGFRFCPTDEELVKGFLSHRVLGHSDYLRADWACSLSGDPIIPTVDLYGKDDDAYPWRVCQRLAQYPHTTGSTEFYCFTRRTKKHDGCKFNNRSVGDYGTWHGSSGRKSDTSKIYDGGVVVGYKVHLTFKILPRRAATGAGARNGQSKKKKRKDEMENTHWVMHEYTLKGQGLHDMVLCRVRNQKKEREEQTGDWTTPWWEKPSLPPPPTPPQEVLVPVVVGGGCDRGDGEEEEGRGMKRKPAAPPLPVPPPQQQRRGPAASSEEVATTVPLQQQAQQGPFIVKEAAAGVPTAKKSNGAAPLMSTAGGPDGVQCVDMVSAPHHQVAAPPAEAAAPSTAAGGADGDLGRNVAAPLSTAGGPDGAQCVEDISAPHQVAAPSAEAAAAPSTSAGDWPGDAFYDVPWFCDPFLTPTLWMSNSTGD